MADFKVRVRGLAPGASGRALPETDREFIVYDQDSQADAERAARACATEAGVEHAYVVETVRWRGPPPTAGRLF